MELHAPLSVKLGMLSQFRPACCVALLVVWTSSADAFQSQTLFEHRKSSSVVAIIFPIQGLLGVHVRAHEIDALANEADRLRRELHTREGNHVQLVVVLRVALQREAGPPNYSVSALERIAAMSQQHSVVAWVQQSSGQAFMIGQVCDHLAHTRVAEIQMNSGATPFAPGAWPTPGTEQWDRACGELYAHSAGWTGRNPPAQRTSDGREKFPAKVEASVRADDEVALASLLGAKSWRTVKSKVADDARERFRVVERALAEVPMLMPQIDPSEKVSQEDRIKTFAKLIRWTESCPEVCAMYAVPDQQSLQTQVKVLEVQSEACRKARTQIEYLLSGLPGGCRPVNAREYIERRIAVIDELIGWQDKCPTISKELLPPREELERYRDAVKAAMERLPRSINR